MLVFRVRGRSTPASSRGVRIVPALGTAVLVGVTLTYLNTRGMPHARDVGWPLLSRLAWNALVPFSVSLYSQWSTSRRLQRSTQRDTAMRRRDQRGADGS